jgi:hypothetical protein
MYLSKYTASHPRRQQPDYSTVLTGHTIVQSVAQVCHCPGGRITQGNPVSKLFSSQKSVQKCENKHFYMDGAEHDILRDVADRSIEIIQLPD